MDDKMRAFQAKLAAKYRAMLADLDELIATNDVWQERHPGEQPIDVEPFRVHRHGAALALAAIERGEPIPDAALRMLAQPVD
jgi:hypothetical protein